MSRAEDYLPSPLGYVEDTTAIHGVEIGEVIISGEDVWHDSNDVPVYDLLLADGSAVSDVTRPILFSLLPVLPNLPTIEGSPFPNKVVADYTGGS